jgi:hypothetical protein
MACRSEALSCELNPPHFADDIPIDVIEELFTLCSIEIGLCSRFSVGEVVVTRTLRKPDSGILLVAREQMSCLSEPTLR